MEPHTSTPHYRRLVQIASILLAVLGVSCVLSAVALVRFVWLAGGGNLAMLAISAVVGLLLGRFGVFCIAAGWRLWKELSAKSIRDACCVVALMIWGAGYFWLSLLRNLIPGMGGEAWLGPVFLVAAIPAIVFYHFASRWLIAHAPLHDSAEAETPPGVPRSHIRLVAWLVFFATYGAVTQFDIRKITEPGHPLLSLLLLFGCLALALTIYWVGVWLFGQKEGAGGKAGDGNDGGVEQVSEQGRQKIGIEDGDKR